MTSGLPPNWRSVLVASRPFVALDGAVVDALAETMELRTLPAGEILIRQGDAADELFVVLDGRLETILQRVGQPDQPLGAHGPGDLLGELAFLTGGTRLATVRASSEVTLGVISNETMETLIHEQPAVAAALGELSAGRLRRAQLAAYLATLFGIVDPTVIDDVEAAVEFVSLASGEVLVRQGDPGDAAFVVLAGRLRVVVGEPEGGDRIVNDVSRGEMVGEIALLTGEPRSATIYAVRDSELARISEDVFERLTARYPQVMRHVTRVLGTRLQQLLGGGARPVTRPMTVALIPAAPGVAVEPLGRALAEALNRVAPTLLVDRDTVERAVGAVALESADLAHPATLRLAHWLDEQEGAHQYVVCLAEGTWNSWTERAVRGADHVLVVADATSDPGPTEMEARLAAAWAPGRSPRRTLVLVHPAGRAEPLGTTAWLAARSVDGHLHLRTGVAADVDRLARIVTGRAVTLVLGGGGARGFAHVGVIRAMQELGIPIDMVGGTSMGAVIGATTALGWSSDAIEERSRELFAGLFDVTLPLVSILAGKRIWRALDRAFGDRTIEDLWLPFFSVASNLTRAELLIDRAGSVRRAVRSSLSLPGVLPPVYRDGDLVVDGGLLDNVPVDVMRDLNDGGRVIAVDVSPAVDLASSTPFEPSLSGWGILRDRLVPFRDSVRVPSLVDLLNRAAVLGSVHLRNKARTNQQADLYLQIPADEWRLLEFDRAPAITQRGYEQSIEPLRAWWAAERG